MRLSRASTYALHALCFLARQRTREPVATRAIAASTGISVVFLLKALKPCVDRQLLTSATGPRGGYRLARSAKRITVLEVIEAVDGPLVAAPPFRGSRNGADVSRGLTQLVADATKQVRQVYRKATIGKLAGR